MDKYEVGDRVLVISADMGGSGILATCEIVERLDNCTAYRVRRLKRRFGFLWHVKRWIIYDKICGRMEVQQ